jgi:hypothetical protein
LTRKFPIYRSNFHVYTIYTTWEIYIERLLFLYLSTIVIYGQNRFYTRFSTFPLFKCVLNITTNIVSHVLHIYVIVYIIYNIIPCYLNPNIHIFCTENGGERAHSLIFWYKWLLSLFFTNLFFVTQYMFRKLTFLYLFRVLCICTLSCKVYQGIFWWEAVKVSGNSIFTFTRTQTLHLPLIGIRDGKLLVFCRPNVFF